MMDEVFPEFFISFLARSFSEQIRLFAMKTFPNPRLTRSTSEHWPLENINMNSDVFNVYQTEKKKFKS